MFNVYFIGTDGRGLLGFATVSRVLPGNFVISLTGNNPYWKEIIYEPNRNHQSHHCGCCRRWANLALALIATEATGLHRNAYAIIGNNWYIKVINIWKRLL